ncbi:MAG: peroxiredoxin-like family protein [Gemmobacter sp.]
MTLPAEQTVEDVLLLCRDSDMPLREQLAAVAAADAAEFPAFVPPVQSLIARLTAGEVGHAAPRIGEAMPPFGLPDETGRIVSLDDLLETGPLAIVFHRGHWCPYCRVTSAALARAFPDIAAAGGHIVTILPERQPFAAQLKTSSGATWPFLVDIDNGYALSLGLAFWMGEELARLYREGGEVIARYQGNEGWMLPIPATFVVGRDGLVAARFVNPDYRNRMAIADLVTAIRAAAD